MPKSRSNREQIRKSVDAIRGVVQSVTRKGETRDGRLEAGMILSRKEEQVSLNKRDAARDRFESESVGTKASAQAADELVTRTGRINRRKKQGRTQDTRRDQFRGSFDVRDL